MNFNRKSINMSMTTTIIVQRFLFAPAQLLFILYADDILLITLDFILRRFWESCQDGEKDN